MGTGEREKCGQMDREREMREEQAQLYVRKPREKELLINSGNV